ncbi:MAG TPA: lantibiotic dehydratase [Streptosporangiaceae bacterium]|nr:lantibiotic dehydratase [Streptosporangiaceae bacterium]
MARRPFAVHAASPPLARIPLLPACPREQSSPEPDPLLTEGIFLASRQVGRAVTERGPGDCGQLAATLRGYEIRARSRPTPHGVFAGVARARFTGEASLRLGAGHQARTNPGPGWLAAVCSRALEDPGVLPLLVFTASNLVTRRGQRFEHEQQAVPGEAGPQRVTVRATDATALIMSVCEAGAPFSEILAALTRRWPAVPESLPGATVLALARAGFLLTDLLPADQSGDPLGHLLGRLPPASTLRDPLSRLRRLLAEADQHPPGDRARLAALTAATATADEICFGERPLAVDVVADADVVLPKVLADEAAAAAGTLWQVGLGQDPLAGYHDRFLARYGPHRFVPLLEATDPAVGLDLDADDFGAGGIPPLPRRNAALAGLLGQAAALGSTEVILDAATIAALARDQPAAPPPRTAEVYVRVIAASEADLTAGRLFLAVCPAAGSQDAGSTAGRVAALLPGTPASYDTHPAALVAELVICPRTPRAATLAPPAGFTPWRIPVGVPPEKGDLDLEDLLLVSDGHHLMAWSARRDQQVIPVLYSRLASRLLPPIAVFLQLLGHAGARPWHSWSWGALQDSPFQPRVRYGRTVLAPARWLLPPALTAAARDQAAWRDALDAWQAGTVPAPPAIVVTEDADRRLPLDLRRPDDRELLRRYVRRGVAAVTEQPGGPDAVQAVIPGPAGHHILEVVVSLASATGAPCPPRPGVARPRTAGAGLHLPGGEWLSLAICAPASCHDEILSSLAAVAVGLAGRWDRWFWLRYHDAARGSHVRARFHGHPAALGGHVLPAISVWCTGMIRQHLSGGFTVEPYDQEIERYGGSGSISAAEEVFAADSRLALAVLTATADPSARIVMAALSAAAIAHAVAGGDTEALRGRQVGRAARKRLEEMRPQARSAIRPGAAWPTLWPGHPDWAARTQALIAYRETLAPAQRPSCASALIHMHANRLLGGTDTEPLARALAADLLARPA